MSDEIKYLTEQATQLRLDVVSTVYQAGDGHPGPAMSIADIVTALYFKIMNVDPENPKWPDRDRFILSKGHSCPILYSALARKGYFSPDALPTLRSLDSILQGHPVLGKTPGVDMTSGSLGNGLSIGLGMAIAGKYIGKDYNVYVIVGDGEIQEGIVWEGAMAAVKHKAGRLIVFLDNNGYQSGGSIEDTSCVLPLKEKFEAFGWHCQEIDGHNMEEIIQSVEVAKGVEDQPSIIIAKTTKGKGIPYMENDNSWHKRVPTKDQYEEAVNLLGGVL